MDGLIRRHESEERFGVAGLCARRARQAVTRAEALEQRVQLFLAEIAVMSALAVDLGHHRGRPHTSSYSVWACGARRAFGGVAASAGEFRPPRIQRAARDTVGVFGGRQSVTGSERQDPVTLFGGLADLAPLQSTIRHSSKPRNPLDYSAYLHRCSSRRECKMYPALVSPPAIGILHGGTVRRRVVRGHAPAPAELGKLLWTWAFTYRRSSSRRTPINRRANDER